MRKLLIIAAFLCAPCTADAATNLLAGCKNCNLRTVTKTVVAETAATAVAVAEVPVKAVRAVAKARPRMECANGACRLRGSRAVSASRRGWFGRRIVRSRVRH